VHFGFAKYPLTEPFLYVDFSKCIANQKTGQKFLEFDAENLEQNN
jgi:hypothetical protein